MTSFRPQGSVDENVFAYSNRNGANGRWWFTTTATVRRTGPSISRLPMPTRRAPNCDKGGCGEGSASERSSESILAWRDSLTGLEYLRRANDLAERGLTPRTACVPVPRLSRLARTACDGGKPWDRLCDHLNGRGVPSLDDALVNLELQPVHHDLRWLLQPESGTASGGSGGTPSRARQRRSKAKQGASRVYRTVLESV